MGKTPTENNKTFPSSPAATMDDIPIHKLQIPGPILSSLLHRFSSSPGSVHGFLYGNFTVFTPSISDDDPSTSDQSPLLTVTITSFLSFPSQFPLSLHSPPRPPSPDSFLLGWFSGRRKTLLRPSLKESTTTISMSYSSLSEQNAPPPSKPSLPPSLFLLMTTPLHDKLTHTHEYKAYHYRVSSDSFEPKSTEIVNIGPSFRTHYESFSPDSVFPRMCTQSGDVDDAAEYYESMTLMDMKQERKDQKKLNFYSEGFEIERLRGLMGSNSSRYTKELEDLYDKMLAKLQGLARSVESTSAMVLEQESHNLKLRRNVAGLE